MFTKFKSHAPLQLALLSCLSDDLANDGAFTTEPTAVIQPVGQPELVNIPQKPIAKPENPSTERTNP